MKTTALFFSLLACSIVVHAQIQKGRWMMGGTADFSHTSGDETIGAFAHDSKVTSYRVLPGGGYFFMDKFCAGIRVNVSRMKTKENFNNVVSGNTFYSSYETTGSGIGFSPFFRYYILAPARKINVFAEASYAYNDEKIKTKNIQTIYQPGGQTSISQSTSDNRYKGNYYSVSAGPVVFISQKVSFEIAIGYTAGRVKDWDRSTNRIMIGTGFQVYL